MTMNHPISRRAFVSAAGIAAVAPSLVAAKKKAPITLELYSVREECQKDIKGTLRSVAKIGYQGVEFFGTYFQYTPQEIKELRQLLDELKMPCVSTHNGYNYLNEQNLSKAIEYNQALGAKHIIVASAGRVSGAKGWEEIAARLNVVADKLAPLGMKTGFHNHADEFKPLEGKVPMDILGQGTGKNVVLQLDVGAAISAGADPIAFIKKYPGRIGAMHVKDYDTGGKGFKVLIGEGSANWKEIFKVTDKIGGIEHYIVEQEGADYPPLDTVERCYKIMRKLRA